MPADSARPGDATGAAANSSSSSGGGDDAPPPAAATVATTAAGASSSSGAADNPAAAAAPASAATAAAAAPGSVTAEYPASETRTHAEANPKGRRLGLLTLTALGVVYGDIGTSPLYSIKECFAGVHGVAPTVPNVYGVLSLIVWALTLVITVKYITFILRADNRGEGGILALLALVMQRQHRDTDRRRRFLLVALGLFGAALLYGDGVITPAISVLGAVEGLNVISPSLDRWVVALTIVILVGLFFFQRHG
ncbi:MAG TPA: KUP/HAK/KT family potassium transporter, partial [Gemmatimonadaceae bacterium]|nr:KUP/HAK/KT family potassium transporter [Gemmatimonadaceae bacterium]